MKIPRSTYRIQFNSTFTFIDAINIIPYLSKLGISTIYASPIFKAKKGTMHGYDIVEPNSLNSELGTQDDFDNLISKIKEYNIEWLQDIVPNHMAYSHENTMLIDLLENGPNSRYFNFFDIEWNHPHQSVRERLLAPFLGKFYKEALESGEIKIIYNSEGFIINYYEIYLPIKIESYSDILSFGLPQLRNKIGRNNPDIIKYLGVLYALKSIPSADEIDERYNQIKFVKSLLWELYSSNQEIKMSVDETIKTFNGEPGNPISFNLLDELLKVQHFRLAYWKVANEEINYRRFFNINELISLRMENDATFNRTHTLILRYIKEDIFNGLRVDHVDGLYDPTSYLSRLKERNKNLYIVVEKILELSEELPEIWPIEGTTGYDFMNYVNGLFCKSSNEKIFDSVYRNFTGFNTTFENLVLEKKRIMITARMAGEVERLAFMIESISSKDRYGIDITMHGLKRALEEVLTYFPIYRTYISKFDFIERDSDYIHQLFDKLRIEAHRYEKEYFYIEKLLSKDFQNLDEDQKEKAVDFIMKFQQLTGPIMAKGLEDTALYIFNRFISLNEVGGNPGKFGMSDLEFHNYMIKRKDKWPYSFNATSTHDSKRGEDVRARINVLSEIPGEWKKNVRSWNSLNKKYKSTINGRTFPDKNNEYFIYQTIIGTFPFLYDNLNDYKRRIKNYAVKALREGKIFSDWVKPRNNFEKAYQDFIEDILSDNSGFMKEFLPFFRKITFYSLINSLSQTLIKITAPGIPDFYQGTEFWDLFLVDPDNRHPIDYALRYKTLDELSKKEKNSGFFSGLINNYENGFIKLYFMNKCLQFRNNNIDIFLNGEYIPLKAAGKHYRNIFGFIRRIENKSALIIVPRFLTEVIKEPKFNDNIDYWGDTSLIVPGKISNWKNCLTGEELEAEGKILVGKIFASFPEGFLINHK